MFQLLMGMWHSQILSALARLGVADAIERGVTSSEALARELDASPDALHRLLRAGASLGLLAETAPRQFALTAVGQVMRADAPGSLRDLIIAETAPGHWLPWGHLYDAVKSGRSVAGDTLGMPVWEYYAKNADEGQCFARAMGNLSAIVGSEIVQVYDASPFKRIVDVGGSQGALLRGLLGTAPDARGILFDLPEIIEGARSVIASTEFADRIELVAGSFLESVPEGDLYLLKSIVHDWPDEDCVRILRNVHRAAHEKSRVLVIEMIVPDKPQGSPVAFMDLNMLVMLGGRERSAEEFASLLAAGGFRVERVIPTAGLFSVIEAVRA
jgi:hypothetical protein